MKNCKRFKMLFKVIVILTINSKYLNSIETMYLKTTYIYVFYQRLNYAIYVNVRIELSQCFGPKCFKRIMKFHSLVIMKDFLMC